MNGIGIPARWQLIAISNTARLPAQIELVHPQANGCLNSSSHQSESDKIAKASGSKPSAIPWTDGQYSHGCFMFQVANLQILLAQTRSPPVSQTPQGNPHLKFLIVLHCLHQLLQLSSPPYSHLGLKGMLGVRGYYRSRAGDIAGLRGSRWCCSRWRSPEDGCGSYFFDWVKTLPPNTVVIQLLLSEV